MKTLPMSATMAAALACAIENGGKLVARTWGSWTYSGAPRDWNSTGVPDWFHRRATVEALVKRGAMKFVEFKLSRGRKLPIAAEVVA